jgi:type I restriction enzyme S subunit
MKKGIALSLPKGWEIKSLGEIADVEYGFTDKSEEEGDYRYVRITDIDSNGELISTEKKYLKHSKEAEGFLIRDKDLLMARTGATFAKVLLYQDFEPSVFASYLIRIKFKEKFENKLYWYFTKTKSYWEQANSLASGAAQPHFNGAAVKQVVFSYPKSLPEQQRIVSILDEAFAAIAKAKANAEQNLKNAKELFESYLQGVFDPSIRSGQGNKGEGWESKELIEVCEQITDGSHFSPKSSGEDEYPYITVRDIDEDIIDFDNCKFICKKDYQSLLKNGCKPNSGDLLFSKDGTVGKVSLVDFEKDFVVLSSLAIIRPKSKIILSPLLKYILKDPLFLKTAIGMKTGVAIRRIILKNLKLIVISFPKSLKEQQNIVQKLDALSTETKKLEANYQQKIKDLEELKKSVLQKAFSGELRGGEPVEPKTEKK